MPIVRSPWTLLCPRIGDGPAPGLPMLPRSSRKFTISRRVATAFLCWVRPIAQQTMMLFASMTSAANSSMAGRLSPLNRSMAAQSSVVEGVFVDQHPVHAGEQRQVTVDPDLQEPVGQLGALAN